MTIKERLFSLRAQMSASAVDAYIIPGSDPHMSEYLAAHWKFRQWISGFTGSAGTVVVLAEKAGLWTDSRYFIQAEKELEGSGIELFRMGMPGVPTYQEWLVAELQEGAVVGIDGRNIAVEEARKLAKTFNDNNIRFDAGINFQDKVWEGRPPIPENEVFGLDVRYTGVSRTEKLEMVRKEMKKAGASHYVICALDEIAWLLNLRGSDVEYNPVFHSFMVVSSDTANLFINPHKVTSDLGNKLTTDGIKIYLYDDFYEFLRTIPEGSSVFIDPQKVNYAVISSLPHSVKLHEGPSIVTMLKGIKNPVEIKGMKNCHIRDGVAMVKFLYWLENNIGKTKITELSAAEKLQSFRKEQENYRGDSFNSISAYGANAALPHYSATKENDAELKPEGLYLIDSGGQYLDGTTDITRTVHLGKLTEEEKKDFTLVLKGHINLSQTVFPAGTRGVHLDIMARGAMWKKGINYGHGTGHGVGHMLNVHEGPQSIRQQDNGVEMKANMITSNEPGIYKEGRHGIRTENLILSVTHKETEFGTFFAFETITMCPVDTEAIDVSLLREDEKEWLNSYHKTVYKKLKDFLQPAEKEWLKKQTRPI